MHLYYVIKFDQGDLSICNYFTELRIKLNYYRYT